MTPEPQPLASKLPVFPWDRLSGIRATAHGHPDGVVNLTIGVPVDDTPNVVQQALADAANAPAYPLTIGIEPLRQAIIDWFARVRNVPGLTTGGVLPTTGSKEVVGWLACWLGLTDNHTVAIPDVAYPTYAVGANVTSSSVVTYTPGQPLPDDDSIKLIWVNSPSNPTGRVADVAELRSVVTWARQRGAVVASDECYATLPWTDTHVPSLLDPAVCDGDHQNLLVLHSLSKQSSMAGYRAAVLAGCPELVAGITHVRRHSGMMVADPVQRAMLAALTEDDHVAAQRQLYLGRLATLRPALAHAGFTMAEAGAGLYLWATAGQDCWQTAEDLAKHGLLVTPGEIYGTAGSQHIRVALTITDDQAATAAERFATYAAARSQTA